MVDNQLAEVDASSSAMAWIWVFTPMLFWYH